MVRSMVPCVVLRGAARGTMLRNAAAARLLRALLQARARACQLQRPRGAPVQHMPRNRRAGPTAQSMQ